MRRREESLNPPANPDPSVFLPLPHLPFQVLLALAAGPCHGWGVIGRIREVTGGAEQPSTGSLYLAMARLEERGLIRDTPTPTDETDSRRRYFRLTALGRRVLAAETDRMASLVKVSRRWLGGGGMERAG
ncbi:MAG: helix-turn-helix transcriptional regulator [Gemmatimonadetes bacterium]|nr:helix-turn-helix transcriptional regulator [Gemmatimonadota bacterium]